MSNITEPLISILIPVYNHEYYVNECIRSIWNQNSSRVEIIAIDDGSTDGSYLILECLASESPIPMRIEQQNNQGVVKTANRALKLATGKYILCMASDDKLLPESLQTVIDEIDAHQNLSFAMFNARYFGNVDSPVYCNRTNELFKRPLPEILASLYTDPPTPLLLQSTIINRNIFVTLGGWNEDISLDDWPIFLRLFADLVETDKNWLYNANHFLTGYRIHDKNVHKDTSRQLSMVEAVIDKYCPLELKKDAYIHAYVNYGLTFLRRNNWLGFKLLIKATQLDSVSRVIALIFNKSSSYLIKRFH